MESEATTLTAGCFIVAFFHSFFRLLARYHQSEFRIVLDEDNENAFLLFIRSENAVLMVFE